MQIGVSEPLGDVVKGRGSWDAVGEIALVIEGIFHRNSLRSPFLLLSSQHLDLPNAHHVLVRFEFETIGKGRRLDERTDERTDGRTAGKTDERK